MKITKIEIADISSTIQTEYSIKIYSEVPCKSGSIENMETLTASLYSETKPKVVDHSK